MFNKVSQTENHINIGSASDSFSIFGDGNHVTVNNITVIGDSKSGILADLGVLLNAGEQQKALDIPLYDYDDMEDEATRCKYYESGNFCEKKCRTCQTHGAKYEKRSFGDMLLLITSFIPVIGVVAKPFTKTDFSLLIDEPEFIEAEIYEEEKLPYQATKPPMLELEPPKEEKGSNSMSSHFARMEELNKQLELLKEREVERKIEKEVDIIASELYQEKINSKVDNRFNDEFQRRLKRA